MDLLRKWRTLLALLTLWTVSTKQDETTLLMLDPEVTTNSATGIADSSVQMDEELSSINNETNTAGSIDNQINLSGLADNGTSLPGSTTTERNSLTETPGQQSTGNMISKETDASSGSDTLPSTIDDDITSQMNAIRSLWNEVMSFVGNDTRTQEWRNVACALWKEMMTSEWNDASLAQWNDNMTLLWEEIMTSLEGNPVVTEWNNTMVTLWNDFIGSQLSNIITFNIFPEDPEWLPPILLENNITLPHIDFPHPSDWDPIWGPSEGWSRWVTPEENPGWMPPKGGFGWVPSQEDPEWIPPEEDPGRLPIKGGFGWVPSKEDLTWVPSNEDPGWLPSVAYPKGITPNATESKNNSSNTTLLEHPAWLPPIDEDINGTQIPFPEDGWGYPYEEEDETVEVSLKQGIILGRTERTGSGGRYFYSFRGIPYAEPPVESLRFKDPVPASPWNETRDGTIDPPKCPQLQYYITVGEEDCLYLNVYTPKLNASDLPVMVWIHGGSFVVGGADEYPPLPLMTKDIVLVTIQYRLGTLGFLSTEDEVLPGNLGLKDQTLALHWVKDNIRDLGGDPNKVTIFGQSAGAASVHLQVVSPKARGLFKQAIMQSGSALSQWAIRTDHREVAITVGKEYNCSAGEGETFDSSVLLECLQDLSLNDIVGIPSLFTMIVSLPTVMTPRVDGDFLPDHPASLLKQGIYNKVDVITGVNQHDGAIIALPFLLNPWLVNELMENFDVAGPALMSLEKESSSVNLARQILDQYLHGMPISMAMAYEFVHMISDLGFKSDHDEVTKIHAGDADLGFKTYSYELQYRGQYSFTDLYGPDAGTHWVTLADDLPYLFNSRLTILRQLDDLIIRDLMVDLWTNFARTGDPTPNYDLYFQWLPVTPTCLRYLAIDRLPHMMHYDRTMVMEFWRYLPLETNSYLNPPHKWQSFVPTTPPLQSCWG